MDENPDKVYLEQLKGPLPFEFSGVLSVSEKGSNGRNQIPGVKLYRSIQDLTECSDALIFLLATPPVPETITDALKKFKHLFFSSPALLPNPKLAEIKKLAEEANVLIRIGNQARFNHSFQAVKDRVHKPIYIEFRRTGTPGLRSLEAMKVRMVSDIEMAVNLMPGHPRKIQTQGGGTNGTHPGVLYARIEFDSGTSASFTYIPMDVKETHTMNLFQPNEHFTVDFFENSVTRSFIGPSLQEKPISPGTFMTEQLNMVEGPLNENGQGEIHLFFSDIQKSKSTADAFDDSFLAHNLTTQIFQRLQS